MRKIILIFFLLTSIIFYSQGRNFDITNANDSGSGSLRQVILDCNADNTATLTSPHTINVRISTAPTSRVYGSGGEYIVNLLSPLPALVGHVSIGTFYNDHSSHPFSRLIISGNSVTGPGMIFNTTKLPENQIARGTFINFSPAILWVTNTNNDGPGSLRHAIFHASLCGSATSKDFIFFNIPGICPHKINLVSSLPQISSPLVLDASVQPANGYTGSAPKIELDGTGVIVPTTAPMDPFRSLEYYSLIRRDAGLVASGLFDYSGNDVEIYGFYIHNFKVGIHLIGNNYKIGRNVISGNEECAILLGRSYNTSSLSLASATNVEIKNNIIGTTPNGKSPEPNGIVTENYYTVGAINMEGSNIKILNNLISGNNGAALSNFGQHQAWYGKTVSNLEVKGNKIGTDIDGSFAIPNNGILELYMYASNVTIGGSDISDRNLLSGNVGIYNASIYFGATTNFNLENNLIGTDVTGTYAIPNNNFKIKAPHSTTTIPYGTIKNNIIAYNNGSELLSGRYSIITKNSIYNNTSSISGDPILAAPTIISRTTDSIKGTAKANVKIELYEDNGFNSFKQGKDFIGEVLADNKGNWKYEGAIANPCNVIAIAIDVAGRRTSHFSGGSNYLLGSNKIVCHNDTLTLDAGQGYSSYLWSTGATTSTIKVTQPGEYWVEINNGCPDRDTVTASFIPRPVVSLGTDTILCAGQSLTLNAGNSGATYKWNNAAGTQTRSVASTGTFIAEVAFDACKNSDTIVVTYLPTFSVDLGADTVGCNGQSISINAKNSSLNFLWSTGATSQTINVTTPGNYSVYVSYQGRCGKRDTINVQFVDCEKISGVIFNELNSDCIKNSNEQTYNGKLIVMKNITNSKVYYTTSDEQGYYEANLPLGTYEVSLATKAFQQIKCPLNNLYTVNLSGSSVIPSCNFGINMLTVTDFSVGLNNMSNLRLNSNVTYNLTYSNQGSTTLGGVVKFIKDPFLSFGAQSISGTINGDTLIYNYPSMSPGAGNTIPIVVAVPFNQTLAGQSLCMKAIVIPADTDNVLENNYISVCRIASYPYDPNNKLVSPGGVTNNGLIQPADSILYYTINFQNTGNDTAYTVVIKDTISSLLEITSLQPTGSSHPYNFKISGEGVATFTFNNIMLPDSNVNEPASHGFIQFSIKRKKNIPDGSVIRNEAFIYFDLAAPVQTDEAIVTLNTLLKSQTISFDQANIIPYGSTIQLIAFASSGLDITYSSSKPSNLIGTNLVPTELGEIRIRAYQNGNNQYTAASYIDKIFTVAKATQTISFDSISNAFATDTLTLTASGGGSGIPVVFVVMSGPAVINEDRLSFTGSGTVTVRAVQAGNNYYYPAATVTRTFNVSKKDQIITFDTIPDLFITDIYALNVSGGTSGNPIIYTVVSGPAAIDLDNSVLSFTGTGTITILASQPGDEYYNDATSVTRTFNVSAIQTNVLDVNKTEGLYYEIYPNPSHGNFTIEFPAFENNVTGTLTILNSAGAIVDVRKAGNYNEYNFDLGKGTYFVVYSNAGKQTTKKIVIE